ncbi:MAG: hypothetical protein Tsb005_14060 [Gammaproteobacteria bacterium]
MKTLSLFLMLLMMFGMLSQTSLAYEYNVSGSDSNGNAVYGNVSAEPGNREVEGYLYDDAGDSHYFSGLWNGYGHIEGETEDGESVSLDVD